MNKTNPLNPPAIPNLNNVSYDINDSIVFASVGYGKIIFGKDLVHQKSDPKKCYE